MCAKTRQEPSGVSKTDDLESRGSVPDLHVYIYKKMGGEGRGTWKIPRISSSLLALKTGIEL